MKRKSKNTEANKKAQFTVRLAEPLDQRLGTCAFRLDIAKMDIARHALRAIVEAIESADYKLAWPPRIDFQAVIEVNRQPHKFLNEAQAAVDREELAAAEAPIGEALRPLIRRLLSEEMEARYENEAPPSYSSKQPKRS